ncbi:DUF2834 domain-containing protein [Aurantimicrobium minutum]|uniref:DUF2834 domain-containing protein n=1 Tax=Aurantimicrobium minutum TaxID=708131 RepID=A0A173LY57_9MICO|nr:DUF2834 domain-containing protein [Aurantimicrobium minutum]BAU99778.1 Uncharacterized protein AUMI_112360 [Aurantimicrobium minutum]
MHKKLFWVYLVLSIAGLITAWIFNGIAVMNQEDYLGAWFGSAVDWVLSADLTIVAIAVVVFMITESRRIGMKRVWLYILLSGVTAMAFTFPLFMAMRERQLAKKTLLENEPAESV